MIAASVSTEAARASLAMLMGRIESGAARVLENVGAAAEKAARSTTTFKDRTGELRSSIVHRATAGTARVTADARHARFVENGTHPHVIEPKNGKFLRFVVNGHVVFARRVRHPGTKPAHFMQGTANIMRPIFLRNMEQMVTAAIRR